MNIIADETSTLYIIDLIFIKNELMNFSILNSGLTVMKLFNAIFLFIISASLTYAQPKTVEAGTIETIDSKILNEKRDLWVHIPLNMPGESSPSNEKRYPVLYLLDGDWHFLSVAGTLQQMSFINGNTICPEMIIVGIISKDRYSDLTPSRDSGFSPTSGGGQKFMEYIEKEVIPFIESKYKVEPYRMFVGHSLGGLTVINALISKPSLFNSYVAIDPSMWWDNQKYLKLAEQTFNKENYKGKSLFLAVANSMDKGMDTANVKNDQSDNTRHIRSILMFENLLKKSKGTGLEYESIYYENENHGSVPHIAFYDALHFIFGFYNLPLTKKDFAVSDLSLAERIKDHYAFISEKMGYKILPSENFINMLGYNSLMGKSFNQAGYYFKMNVDNYPKSYNAYDSYGDYFEAIGDNLKAIEMYSRALEFKNDEGTRQKLMKLSSKK